MKKDIILYSLSTAFNKGSVLLFFPLLTQLLTLEDFGRWSLAIIVSNLLIPVISLNGSAGILREGSENTAVGFRLLYLFSVIAVVIGMVSFFGASTADSPEWLVYAIIIASAEAILLLALTFIRTQEKALTYFLINIFKALTLLSLVLYAKEYSFSLPTLLFYHFMIVAFFATVVLCSLYRHYSTVVIAFKPIFIFCVALIPHGMSQWIMSSSDRMIIETMLGSESVGIYSLAYNIALILMLLNSGLSMALPTYMIKNYDNWISRGFDNLLIRYYTCVSLILYIFVLGLYLVDSKKFKYLGYYGNEMLLLIGIIFLSVYLLGLYYFYANYLFFHKKASVISRTTFLAATLNVVLTFVLIRFLGVVGAAVATLLSYVFYLVVIRREALKVDNNIPICLLRPLAVFLCGVFVITAGFYYV